MYYCYSRPLGIRLSFVALLLSTCSSYTVSRAQSNYPGGSSRPIANRLNRPIEESVRVMLGGTVHPLARISADRGAVSDSMELDRVQVVLKRSEAQESELKQLISEIHTPDSPNYRKWLTPEQFGTLFGPSDQDIAKLEDWLKLKGFSDIQLSPGHQTLQLSGTAGRFRNAFHAQIHSYSSNGDTHFANASDPQIPAALAPVFGGFVSLNNFPIRHYSKVVGKVLYNVASHEAAPQWTAGTADDFTLLLTPGDFAVQYDLGPLYTASTPITGAGQSIAIINEANINVALVNRYRALFNLPVNPPQIIIDGNDPGVDGINNPYGPNYASQEAYLDVEQAGAVAPSATINLVIAADTALSPGLYLAAQRAVYSNVSPVMSISFGQCEQQMGSTNQFLTSLWEQAAAQGITVVVSTGDSGAAGCDDFSTQTFALNGQAINGFASTPYNVAVGGTDFFYSDFASSLPTLVKTYWNTSPATGQPTVSLLKPVPEQVWNESQYGLNLDSYFEDSGETETTIAAGGGGASNCATGTYNSSTGTYGACSSGWSKPSWQSGPGVPNDQVRDIPDLSLFASSSGNLSAYPICAFDGDCEPGGRVAQVTAIGGTSAAAPAFAGIMALVNQRYGRQGQATYTLYPLARQFPVAFHDVTVGTNSVPCNMSTVTDISRNDYPPNDCVAVSNPLFGYDPRYGSVVEGQTGLSANNISYNAGTGYDLGSGLGTVDAYNLVMNWDKVRFTASTTTLNISQKSFVHGTSITLSGVVTSSASGSVPTGSVALLTDNPGANQQGLAALALANGSFNQNMISLPGGTYNIWGYYDGDASISASTSARTSITVSPEDSTTTLTMDNPRGESLTAVPYGAPLVMSATPAPAASAPYSLPTGSVVFNDRQVAINTAVISSSGKASYDFAYPVGTHAITASYSGDRSYRASSSSAANFTVVRDTPYYNVSTTNTNISGQTPNGQQTIVTVQLGNTDSTSVLPLPPTGRITLTNSAPGSTSTATLVPAVDPLYNAPEGTAIFVIPSGASGDYDLTFSYTGDANYNPVSFDYPISLVTADSRLTSAVAATASALTTGPSGYVQVTTAVSGPAGGGFPTGHVTLWSSGQALSDAVLPVGTGNSSLFTFNAQSSSLFQGTNQITVQYSGDTVYLPSATTITVSNPLSDFSLVPLTSTLSIPSIGTQTAAIRLVSFNSFAGTVKLFCTAAAGITCSFDSSSPKLLIGGSATAILTVSVPSTTPAGIYSVVVTGSDSAGLLIHTLGLQAIKSQSAQPPLGNLEVAIDSKTASAVVSQGDSLYISGWTADPADGAPLANVKIYLDGSLLGTPSLGLSRPDVASYTHNNAYINSGYVLVYPGARLAPGSHTITAVAINSAGLSTNFGPLTITVKSPATPPLGNFEVAVDSLTASATVSQAHQIYIGGWVADPQDGAPLANVKVYIDGVLAGTPSVGIPRPDVASYTGNLRYANSGYALTCDASTFSRGAHAVTVVATDSAGLSTTFGPRTITVIAKPPTGNLEVAVDSVTGGPYVTSGGALYVGGWAAEYQTNGPAKSVQIFIDGISAGFATMNEPRPDVAAYFGTPAWSNAGWSYTLSAASLSAGGHTASAQVLDSANQTTTLRTATFTKR